MKYKNVSQKEYHIAELEKRKLIFDATVVMPSVSVDHFL
jgi:hypothetical protein